MTITQRHHVEDGTLSAFIDGQLSGPERDAVVVHLADCSSCFEIYSDVLELLAEEEEGAEEHEPVPLARGAAAPATSRYPAWLPLAASIALVAVTALLVVQLLRPSSESSATLLAGLGEPLSAEGVNLDEIFWKEQTFRSDEENLRPDWSRYFFSLGVRVVDLRAANVAGDQDDLTAAASRLDRLIKTDPGFAAAIKIEALEILDLEDPRERSSWLSDLEAELIKEAKGEDSEFEDDAWRFENGQRIEAAYIAAGLGHLDYFDSSRRSALQASLQSTVDLEKRTPSLSEDVAPVAKILETGGPTDAQQLEEVQNGLAAILRYHLR